MDTFNLNETIVPGRNYSQSSSHATKQVANSAPANAEAQKDNTPVVGFLYSISREGIGEYWPIKLGRNTIGRSSSCSIQLLEGSVSDLHASLSVKIMKSTGRLVASVRDEGSKTGLLLNDEELDYDTYACKNLDVMVVGSSYRLLIVLIDAVDYGLTAAENFVVVNEKVATATSAKSELPSNSVNNDPFARPAGINLNETIDIEGRAYGKIEKTQCL